MIIITGTPGTGKTTLAKSLAKKIGFDYVDLNEFARSNNFVVGYDELRDCDIIDEENLSEKIIHLPKDSIIDSHMSHFIDSSLIDKCIVTKCNLAELKKRLEARGYSSEKVRENLDSEIFDTCRIEAEEEGYNPIIVWTDQDIDKQLADIEWK